MPRSDLPLVPYLRQSRAKERTISIEEQRRDFGHLDTSTLAAYRQPGPGRVAGAAAFGSPPGPHQP